jgi:hypothetical protein
LRDRLRRIFVVTCVGLALGSLERTQAQAPVAAEITFTFDHAEMPVPHYVLSVDETGAARYKATDASGEIERPAVVSGATTARMFALVRHAHLTQEACASKAKNIADTGTKTLLYASTAGSETCSYNFSQNKDVQQLTSIFQGIAETLDEGRTLERLHKYDRLGLDAEMISYVQQVADGDAIEVGAIAESLQSIADDSAVILRVRKQAAKLLAAPGGSR